MSHAFFFRPRAAQGGAVLVTALVFLVVLTMFVLALVRSGTLEERMARNARDQQMAREAAEAVLRDAEAVLFAAPPFDSFDLGSFAHNCPNGLCFKPSAKFTWNAIDWSAANLSKTFSDDKLKIADTTTQPRYIVEIIKAPARPSSSQPCSPGIARLTARGLGNNGATAFVQTVVRFRVFSNVCD